MAELGEGPKPVKHPLFTEKDFKRIRENAKGSWGKRTDEDLKNLPFWEAVGATFNLKERGGYDEGDMLVYSKRDKKGRVTQVLLVNKGQVVYPVFIEKPDSRVLGVDFDASLTASLRQHAERAVPRQSKIRSQQTR